DSGLGSWLQKLHCLERRIGRFVFGRADGATQPVHDGAVGFMLDLVAPTARRMCCDKLSKNAGDGRGVMVGFDFRIDGHGYRIELGKKEGLRQADHASSLMFCSLATRVQRSRSLRT